VPDFLARDYERVAAFPVGQTFMYVNSLALAELGRVAEAQVSLAEWQRHVTDMPDIALAARLHLTGDRNACVAVLERLWRQIPDVEACFYVARHLAHLAEPEGALAS
jgi:hypothetical protein